jgi:hypothetical protein
MPKMKCECTEVFATRDASVGYGQSFVSQADADRKAKDDSIEVARRDGRRRAADFPCDEPCVQSHRVKPGTPRIEVRAPRDAQGWHATALVKWSLYITCRRNGVVASKGRRRGGDRLG